METFLIFGSVTAVVFPIFLLFFNLRDIRRGITELASVKSEELIKVAKELGLHSQGLHLLIPRVDSMRILEEKVSIFDEYESPMGMICTPTGGICLKKTNYPTEIVLHNSRKLLIKREVQPFRTTIIYIYISDNNRTATCCLQPPIKWRWVNIGGLGRTNWVGSLQLDTGSVFTIKYIRNGWRRCHLLEDQFGKCHGVSVQCVRNLDHRATIVAEEIDPLISWLLCYIGIFELRRNPSSHR